MRDIVKIIDYMMGDIPAEQRDLIHDLEAVKASAIYAPPEVMGNYWRRAADVLAHHIPSITEEWHKALRETFAGDKK